MNVQFLIWSNIVILSTHNNTCYYNLSEVTQKLNCTFFLLVVSAVQMKNNDFFHIKDTYLPWYIGRWDMCLVMCQQQEWWLESCTKVCPTCNFSSYCKAMYKDLFSFGFTPHYWHMHMHGRERQADSELPCICLPQFSITVDRSMAKKKHFIY